MSEKQKAGKVRRKTSEKSQQPQQKQGNQPQQDIDADVMDFGNPISDLNNLSRGDMLQLQRTIGNRSLQRLIQNNPQTTPSQPRIQRRMWDKDTWKSAVDYGKVIGSSKTMDAIKKLLTEYYSMSMPLENRIQIVEEILQNSNNWISDHQGDKNRRTRMSGMINFKISVETELEALKNQKQQRDDLGIGNDEGTRQSNLQTIKEKHEGSAKSMFTKLGFLLDSAVPTPGDKNKIEIEFKFPVDPNGVGFLGGHLVLEGERPEKNLVKARSELSITGGAKIGNIAEIKGELGGYMESQAKNSDQVMKLISYAMYRRFEESKALPRKMSNFMWGGSGSVAGFRRAERWAGKVEEEVFGGLAYGTQQEKDKALDTYVESGGFGSVSGEFNVGIGKAKGQIKGSAGTRYDRESIEKRKQGGLGTARKDYTFGVAQEKIGNTTGGLDISAELEAGPLKGEGKVSWKWKENSTTKKMELADWSVEAGLTGSFPMTELVGSGVGPYIGELVTSVNKIVRQAVSETSTTSQNVGAAISIGENVSIGITQLAQVPQDAFKPKFEFQAPTEGFSGSAGVKLGLKIGKGFKGELTLEHVKSIGVDVGVFSGKMEKAERLLRIGYDPDGGWSVD